MVFTKYVFNFKLILVFKNIFFLDQTIGLVMTWEAESAYKILPGKSILLGKTELWIRKYKSKWKFY